MPPEPGRRINGHSDLAVSTIAMICTTVALAWTPSAAEESRPPYSRSEPANEPVIFAEGVVSTALPEFASAFSPAGDMVLFNRMPADRSRIEMLVSRFENGAWSEAEMLPFSGAYRDVDPWISSDGTRVYFSSNRPTVTDAPPGDYDTWYVDITEQGWSEPVRLGAPVNTNATEIFVSMTDSGTLYFRRSDENSRGIFSARKDGDNYATPQEIRGLELASAGNPLVARDGSFLILSGIVDGRAGELFIAFRDGDEWTPARNMGSSVNSEYAEFAPSLSPDGKYLFFTSERPGVSKSVTEGRPPGDIYQIELRAIEGIDWPD